MYGCFVCTHILELRKHCVCYRGAPIMNQVDTSLVHLQRPKTNWLSAVKWGGEDLRFVYWPVTCDLIRLQGPLLVWQQCIAAVKNARWLLEFLWLMGSLENLINTRVPNKPIVEVCWLCHLRHIVIFKSFSSKIKKLKVNILAK